MRHCMLVLASVIHEKKVQEEMEIKLYVGNMSFETTEQDLRSLFSEAGAVVAVDLIIDRLTGKPKGFGFGTMGNQADADKAIGMFNEKVLKTRSLRVNVAKPREERSSYAR